MIFREETMKQTFRNGKKNILITLLAFFILAAGNILYAQNSRTVYRDASGRYKGSAAVNGRTTTYRTSSGKYNGSATTNGRTTTYRDASGRYQGTAAK